MSRTNDADIRLIIEIESTLNTAPFIVAASAMVTAHCSSLDATAAELVELWLSAHFICIQDPRMKAETAKGVGGSYQSKVDLGLNVSHYGQMAMALDSSGGLSKWNDSVVNGKNRTATMSSLATTPTEQLALDEEQV